MLNWMQAPPECRFLSEIRERPQDSPLFMATGSDETTLQLAVIEDQEKI
jgi:hypothetical protein